MDKVEAVQKSGQRESAYLVTKSCLRYVVPFVLEESFEEAAGKAGLPLQSFMEKEGAGSKALRPGQPCWVRKLAAGVCPDGSYYGKLQLKLSGSGNNKSGNGNKKKENENKKDPSKSGQASEIPKTETAAKPVYGLFERRESDLYDFLRNEFCFDTAEGKLGPEKMGCEWLDIRSADLGLAGRKEILSIRYYLEALKIDKPPKTGVDEPEMAGETGKAHEHEHELKYWNIQMTDLGLMLFRNGLGLLWYELALPKREDISASQLVFFQNRVRELNPLAKKNKQTSSFFLTTKNPAEVPEVLEDPDSLYKQHPDYLIPFHFGDWIADVLSPFHVHFLAQRRSTGRGRKRIRQTDGLQSGNQDQVTAAGGKENRSPLFVPDKAILFTYCSFAENKAAEPSSDKVRESPSTVRDDGCLMADSDREYISAEQKQEMLVYQLTNGYRESNHPGRNIGENMYRPFSEAIWYATQEGTAYLSWPQSEDAKRFFDGSVLGRIKADYFPLCMKNLYQSFSLMVYAKRVQEEISAVNGEFLPSKLLTDKDDGESGYAREEEGKDLFGEVNLFLAKGMASSVSHIHQQSEFYLYIKKQLRIREDIQSVTAGLEALNILRERRADEEEKRRDNRISAIVGLFALLGVFSAWTDGLDFLSMVVQDGKIAPLSLLQAGLVVLVLVVAIVALFITIKSFLMNRDKK